MTLETELHAVATRINRTAIVATAARAIATGGFGFCAVAIASDVVPAGFFGYVLAALLSGVGLALLLEMRALRRDWAGQRSAALRIEERVPLDQRLLTWVSAAGASAGTRIWSELRQDNEAHFKVWRDSDLGLAPLPLGPTLLAALALAAVTMILLPAEPPPAPPEMQHAQAEPDASGEPLLARPAEPRTDGGTGGAAPGDAMPPGAQDGSMPDEGTFPGNITGLQERLGETWKSSLAARALGGGRDGGTGEMAARFRGDLPETDIGSQDSQEGGVLPPDNMAHLVEDDGQGQAVRPLDGEGGEALGAGAEGGRPGESRGANPAVEGAGRPADGAPDGADPGATMTSEGGAPVGTGGGPGAGDAPASQPVLAAAPLDLTKRHAQARFALALGATAGAPAAEGDDPGEELAARPLARIAELDATDQESEHEVRHDPIPAEFAPVIGKLFERD